MRVKIGDTWYNSAEQPICLEREQITNPRGDRYASGPDDGVVISNVPGDRTDMHEWRPLFTAPPTCRYSRANLQSKQLAVLV